MEVTLQIPLHETDALYEAAVKREKRRPRGGCV
jgi:hypothetical protein